jgi:hypothetical protein
VATDRRAVHAGRRVGTRHVDELSAFVSLLDPQEWAATVRIPALDSKGSTMKAYLLVGLIMLGLATAFVSVSFFSQPVLANSKDDN